MRPDPWRPGDVVLTPAGVTVVLLISAASNCNAVAAFLDLEEPSVTVEQWASTVSAGERWIA